MNSIGVTSAAIMSSSAKLSFDFINNLHAHWCAFLPCSFPLIVLDWRLLISYALDAEEAAVRKRAHAHLM